MKPIRDRPSVVSFANCCAGLVAGEGGCEEKGSVLAFQHFAFNLFTYSHICVKSLGNFAKNSE